MRESQISVCLPEFYKIEFASLKTLLNSLSQYNFGNVGDTLFVEKMMQQKLSEVTKQ